jgi:hypothetical protein
MATFRGIGRASDARPAAMEPEKKHVDQRAPAARRRAAAPPPPLAKTTPPPPRPRPAPPTSTGELADQLYAQGSAYVGRAAEASARFSHEALANKIIKVSSAASLVGQSKQKTLWKPINQRTTQ